MLLIVCGGLEGAPAQADVQAAPAVNQETNKPGGQMRPNLDPDFVQGQIRITPPVSREKNRHGEPVLWIYNDGGTLRIPIRDKKGRSFDVFIDHRMGRPTGGTVYIGPYPTNSNVLRPVRLHNPTDGAIYLNAYPTESNAIRVLRPDEFRQKVGDFDRKSEHALQRTAAGHRRCNRCASWPPSLSFCR